MLSIGIGIVISLLTGFVSVRTLIGGTHYGFPLAWRIEVVLPHERNPWRFNILYLITDVIFWSIVVGVVPVLIRRKKGKV